MAAVPRTRYVILPPPPHLSDVTCAGYAGYGYHGYHPLSYSYAPYTYASVYSHYGLPYHYGYYGKREAEPTAEPAADAEADPEADPWLYYHGLGYAGLHPYGYGYHGLGTLRKYT